MASSGTFMSLSSLGQGAAGFAGSMMDGSAAASQGAYQKQQYEFNARMAEMQSEDAVRRGDKEAARVKVRGKQMIGAQRAALAAQGIDVNSGSAADVQTETAVLSNEDAMTIKSNAWREAFGFRTQAMDLRSQGDWAYMAGKNKQANSLLTGGMSFLSSAFRAGGESGLFEKNDKKTKKESREDKKAARDERYFRD